MKPSINFENISQQLDEKRLHKKFVTADMVNETNRPLNHFMGLIAIGGAISILTISMVCAVWLNADAIDQFITKAIHYLNDLSTGTVTAVILIVMLCVLAVYRFKRKK